MKAVCYSYDKIVGTIHRDGDGRLVVSDPTLAPVAEQPLVIGSRTIGPDDDEFLRNLPVAYSGSYFRIGLEED